MEWATRSAMVVSGCPSCLRSVSAMPGCQELPRRPATRHPGDSYLPTQAEVGPGHAVLGGIPTLGAILGPDVQRGVDCGVVEAQGDAIASAARGN